MPTYMLMCLDSVDGLSIKPPVYLRTHGWCDSQSMPRCSGGGKLGKLSGAPLTFFFCSFSSQSVSSFAYSETLSFNFIIAVRWLPARQKFANGQENAPVAVAKRHRHRRICIFGVVSETWWLCVIRRKQEQVE